MTIITTKKQQRARTVRHVTASVAAGAVVGLAVAGVAVAAKRTERVLPKLPAPGATIEAELMSKGIELNVANERLRTGPLQGRAVFEIEEHGVELAAVRTKIKEFRLSSADDRGEIAITVEPRQGAERESSALRRASAQSPRFQHTLTLACVITIDNPRAFGLDADKPLKLKSKLPVELSGKPFGFPDDRARYGLKGKAALSVVGSPARDASLVRFPLRIQQF
ncbi:hypothetical protein AB0K52_12535 [Glycomyces sp. NPDC049804]|uniref:hypothetical protein n=1 Tax=Glycomyces sp. NPDC049804 TaxID=3154363 RepID=UPI003415A424